MNQATRDARKLLVWNIPIIVFLMTPLFVWFIVIELLPTLNDMINGAAVLRIYAGSVMAPLVVITTIPLVATVVFKAIPVSDALFKKSVWLTTVLGFSMVPCLIFAAVIARPLQQYYFPKHGYTQCDQLHGNPTMWFTDWVKNPAWCVRGKDLSWVFEQARLAREGAAPSPNASPVK